MPARGGVAALADRLRDIDWTPDLGARIGSLEWFRGAATCLALCTVSWMLGPSLHAPIIGAAPPSLSGHQWDEARAQSIAPLAWGAATGRRMRSEEHTSELQSLMRISYAVFCLKNKNNDK